MPHSRSGGGGQGPASSMGASNQPRCSEVWAPQGSLCSLWPIFPAGDPEGPGTKAAGRSPPGAWMAGAALGWDIAKQWMDGPAAARTAPVRPVRNVLAQRLPCSAVESARGAPVLGPGPAPSGGAQCTAAVRRRRAAVPDVAPWAVGASLPVARCRHRSPCRPDADGSTSTWGGGERGRGPEGRSSPAPPPSLCPRLTPPTVAVSAAGLGDRDLQRGGGGRSGRSFPAAAMETQVRGYGQGVGCPRPPWLLLPATNCSARCRSGRCLREGRGLRGWCGGDPVCASQESCGSPPRRACRTGRCQPALDRAFWKGLPAPCRSVPRTEKTGSSGWACTLALMKVGAWGWGSLHSPLLLAA